MRHNLQFTEKSKNTAHSLQQLNTNITAIHGPYLEEDYNRFIIHPLNRTPEVEDVKKLKKAIEQNFVPEPIKVNEMMEIMDGNHRFEVWKELSMPVLYMVSQSSMNSSFCPMASLNPTGFPLLSSRRFSMNSKSSE